jgi:site-specific DNA-cytosine methylase
LQRNLEARRAKGKGVAADAEGGARGGCYWNGEQVAATLTRKGCDDRMPDKERMFAVLQPTAYRWQNDRDGLQQDDAVAALRASQGASGFHEMNHPVITQPVPYDLFQITAPVNRQNRVPGDPCHTLAKDNAAHAAVALSMTVRRLSPRECERLQGFPDDWTMIPYRGKPPEECPDGPRYKALGNSMACNCMAWIGERIAAYEAQNGST